MTERVDIGDWCTLYHADCMEALSAIEGVDLVVTDPPYSTGARKDASRQMRRTLSRVGEDEDWFSHDDMTTWGFSWFFRGVFHNMKDRLPDGAHCYIFSDWRQTPNVYGIMESCGYRVGHCLVWKKAHFGMGHWWRNQHENIIFASVGKPTDMLDRGMGSVLECAGVPPTTRLHPTQKPIPLLRAIIDAVPGSVVFDPFMGAGSTAIAAYLAKRKFVGVEIDRRWFDVAVERINRQTGDGPLFEAAEAPMQQAMAV